MRARFPHKTVLCQTQRVFALQAAVSVFAIMLLAAPLGAQKMAISSGPHIIDDPSGTVLTAPLTPGFHPLPELPIDDDEGCLPWTALAVRGFTVSIMRLQIPSRARSEFGKACGDLKKRRLMDAEQHARSAIEMYPNYVAAWVMLGQVLEALERPEEAGKACEHASSIDPTYLPPYVCLTEIFVGKEHWDSVLDMTEFILKLNPSGVGYVYFYRALAYYRTRRFAQAEKSALDGANIDVEQGEAPIYFLLAQIYEAEGKSDVAAVQVRHFLKLSPDREKSTEAKQYLAKLESQQATN